MRLLFYHPPRRPPMDCSHTALAWPPATGSARHGPHLLREPHTAGISRSTFQSFIILPVPNISDVCLTIQYRFVKLAAMAWQRAYQSTSALVAWPKRSRDTGVPILFGFCSLNEIDNLKFQHNFLGETRATAALRRSSTLDGVGVQHGDASGPLLIHGFTKIDLCDVLRGSQGHYWTSNSDSRFEIRARTIQSDTALPIAANLL
jgi:hypothetical protein